MAQLLSLSINLSKVDKARIIEGKKGKYLSLTLSVNDQEDQFGNRVSCWHSQSQEEREAKLDKMYLGNGRVLWEGTSNNSGSNNSFEPQKVDLFPEGNDDLPF